MFKFKLEFEPSDRLSKIFVYKDRFSVDVALERTDSWTAALADMIVAG